MKKRILVCSVALLTLLSILPISSIEANETVESKRQPSLITQNVNRTA